MLTAGCSPALRWRLDGGAGRSPGLSAERENCLAEEATRSKALVAQAGNCHLPPSKHLHSVEAAGAGAVEPSARATQPTVPDRAQGTTAHKNTGKIKSWSFPSIKAPCRGARGGAASIRSCWLTPVVARQMHFGWLRLSLVQQQGLDLGLIPAWQSFSNAALLDQSQGSCGWNFTFLHRGRCSETWMHAGSGSLLLRNCFGSPSQAAVGTACPAEAAGWGQPVGQELIPRA